MEYPQDDIEEDGGPCECLNVIPLSVYAMASDIHEISMQEIVPRDRATHIDRNLQPRYSVLDKQLGSSASTVIHSDVERSHAKPVHNDDNNICDMVENLAITENEDPCDLVRNRKPDMSRLVSRSVEVIPPRQPTDIYHPVGRKTMSPHDQESHVIPQNRTYEVIRRENIRQSENSLLSTESLDFDEQPTNVSSNQLETNEDIGYASALDNLDGYTFPDQFLKQDDEGDNALMLAIINNDNTEYVFNIITNIHSKACELLNLQNKLCQAALHLAVLVNQPKIVRRIIQNGARLDIRDGRGNTPLHLACYHGYLACVKQITVSIVQQKEDPVIHYTDIFSQYHDPCYLFTLLNYYGFTCIHLACINGHCDVIEYLLTNSNIDINVRDGTSGRTILHHAIEQSNEKLFQFLVSRPGIDIGVETFSGDSATSLALGRNEQEMCKKLVELQKNITTINDLY